MSRTRPKVSAKEWAEKPDSGFEATTVTIPKDSLFNPKNEGRFSLEIIPYEVPTKVPEAGVNPNANPGDYHYERTYFVHRGIGVDENSYVCPKRTAGKPCPICEYVDKMSKDRNADEDALKEMVPKQRQLWNVLNNDKLEDGVQVWDISYHNFGKQLKQEVRNGDEDDGYEFFADPDDGMTIRVFMESKSFGGGSPFLQASSISFKARKTPLSDEVLKQAHVLDKFIKIYDYDKLKKIFLQEPEEHAEDDDEVEAPPARKEKPKEEEKAKPKPEPKEEPKAKEVTVDDLGLSKGDEVLYKKERWTIIKVLGDGELVNLVNEEDEMAKNVEASDIKPAPKQEKGSTTSATSAGTSERTTPKPEVEPKAEEKPKPKPEPKPEPKSEEPSGESDWDDWD